jgi:hypothetical protein
MAMQPKTSNQFGWFGLLMIATVSGLIIKVVGDPLVQILSPKLEDRIEDIENWLADQEWEERWEDWLKSRRDSED